MKKIVIGLLVLGSLSAFGSEVSVRLTNNNISTVKAFTPSTCVGTEPLLTASYKIVINLVDGKEITIEKSGYTNYAWDCKSAIAKANDLGRSLLNKLNNIKNGDIQDIGQTEGRLVCLKVVGNIVFNPTSSIGTKFEEQSTVVACPK